MELFQVFNNQVSIIKDDLCYLDTVENYLIDGGIIERENEIIKEAVHDSNQNYCVCNNVVINYPDDFFTGMINDVDNLLKNKEAREYVAPTIEELKNKKIEEIKSAYVNELYSPSWFEQTMYDQNGHELEKRYVGYDTDKDSQIDFNSSYERAKIKGFTMYNIYVNPDNLNEKEFVCHTPEMFSSALLAAGEYQERVYIKYYTLKSLVEEAKFETDLKNINW